MSKKVKYTMIAIGMFLVGSIGACAVIALRQGLVMM